MRYCWDFRLKYMQASKTNAPANDKRAARARNHILADNRPPARLEIREATRSEWFSAWKALEIDIEHDIAAADL